MARSLLLLGLAGLWGCQSPGIVECDDGTLCPGDKACVPGGCAAPADVAACAELVVDAPCVPYGGGAGRCLGGACRVPVCGDGLVSPASGEACDDGNAIGGDGCDASCTIAERCGNGVVEGDEACDCGDGATAGPATCVGLVDGAPVTTRNGGPICDDACARRPACGNGVVTGSEVCDDGNLASGDGCAYDCRSDERCGNGIRDFGEECDDGDDVVNDGCQPDCKVQRCGDGTLDPDGPDDIADNTDDEVCDDGNLEAGDGCALGCRSLEYCGNGIADEAVREQCDDGNRIQTDLCHNDCQRPRCGDGLCDPGEECELRFSGGTRASCACGDLPTAQRQVCLELPQ